MPSRSRIDAHAASTRKRRAVHQPNRNLTGILLPKDVVTGIAVEVTRYHVRMYYDDGAATASRGNDRTLRSRICICRWPDVARLGVNAAIRTRPIDNDAC